MKKLLFAVCLGLAFGVVFAQTTEIVQTTPQVITQNPPPVAFAQPLPAECQMKYNWNTNTAFYERGACAIPWLQNLGAFWNWFKAGAPHPVPN